MEITEEKLSKIALFTSFLGLLILFFYSGDLELETITSVDGVKSGEAVKIKGLVGSVSQMEKVAFLDIENQKIESTTVVLFKDKDVWISEGDYVEIDGTSEEYKGEIEIIGHKVTVLGR